MYSQASPSPSLQYFTLHLFPAAPSSSASSRSTFSSLLHLLPYLAFSFSSFLYISSLFFLFTRCSHISHQVLLPTHSFLHIFSSTAIYPCLHPFCRFVSYLSFSLVPSCDVSFLSAFLSLPAPILRSLPLSVFLLPLLTLPLAGCSVGNRHLGKQISVSPLPCWDRFSKNTAKGYITLYAWGSAASSSISPHFFLCVRVFL